MSARLPPNERLILDFVIAAGGSANYADMLRALPELSNVLVTLNSMPELVFSHATSNLDRWYRMRTKSELAAHRERLGDMIERAQEDMSRCLTAETEVSG